MSRALSLSLAALLITGFLASARAAEVDRAPDLIDGTAMVDYSGRPNFTVGQWAKYRTTGSSLRGHQDDYVVTMLIAGEEVWWGEPCFWVETWTEKQGQSVPTATLVSYAAFGDTMASRHPMWFIRKTINGFNPEGQPEIVLYSRDASELKLRMANWLQEDEKVQPRRDSVGTETVSVPAGKFETTKIRKFRGHVETAERGDSTVYYRRAFMEYYFMSRQIPITSLVRVELDDRQEGKTWLVGESDQGPLRMLEHSQGQTVLLEYGKEGLKPRLVPESSRRTIADRKLVEHAYSLPMEPPTKARARGGR